MAESHGSNFPATFLVLDSERESRRYLRILPGWPTALSLARRLVFLYSSGGKTERTGHDSRPSATTAPGRRAGRDGTVPAGNVPRLCRRPPLPGNVWPGPVGYHAVPARRSRSAGNVGPQTRRPITREGRVRGHRH